MRSVTGTIHAVLDRLRDEALDERDKGKGRGEEGMSEGSCRQFHGASYLRSALVFKQITPSRLVSRAGNGAPGLEENPKSERRLPSDSVFG